MKDVIMLEKITCPKCNREYQDIEDIIKCNIRLCYCGTKFTWVKHYITKPVTYDQTNTTSLYEMKEL